MLAATFVSAVPLHGDTITILGWTPSVSVDSPIGYDIDHWETVENPCQRALSSQVGNSVSSGTIDFAWGEVFGTFLIQSNQVAVGTSAGSTWTYAQGQFWLQTAQPLSLSISGSWSYNFPAGFMMTQFGLGVIGNDTGTMLFQQSYTRTTFPGDPPSDTLLIGGGVILPPTETWRIRYWMKLEADAGASNSATGFGNVSFQVSPEPATLALLTTLLLALPRRPARRSRLP